VRLAGQTAVAVAALSRRVTVRDAGRGGFETSQKSKFRANPPKVSITVSSPSELLSFLIKWWSMHLCTVVEGSEPRVERPESRLGCEDLSVEPEVLRSATSRPLRTTKRLEVGIKT
jgi:hypothetical protein